MSKHKGKGYNPKEIIGMAAQACNNSCGCTAEKFRACAHAFAPTTRDINAAELSLANWALVAGPAKMAQRMPCRLSALQATAST